jgi:hypothetical protein
MCCALDKNAAVTVIEPGQDARQPYFGLTAELFTTSLRLARAGRFARS